MKNLFISFLLLSFFAANGQNKQVLKTKAQIDTVCNSFMKFFLEGDYEKSLLLLKQNSVIDPQSIDKLELTITEQMIGVVPTYGKPLSVEFAVEKSLKQSLARRYYLLKLEKYFMKFRFTLYNNGSGWTITNFVYDDENLEEMLN